MASGRAGRKQPTQSRGRHRRLAWRRDSSAEDFGSVAVAAQILDVDKHAIRNRIWAGRLASRWPNRHGPDRSTGRRVSAV